MEWGLGARPASEPAAPTDVAMRRSMDDAEAVVGPEE
jgi:hypothetical protein